MKHVGMMQEEMGQALSAWWSRQRLFSAQKLSTQQLYFICRQLSFALDGGMPLPAALLLIGNEMDSPRCRRFLLQLAEGVQSGQSVAQSLQQIDMVYSPVLLEFVMAGEQNGTMQQTMAQAAEYFQQQHKTNQMLFSAVLYPCVILLLTVLAFVAMFFFVVPAVVQTYDNFQAELPLMTRLMITGSDWLQVAWPLVLVSFFALFTCLLFLLRQLRKRAGGRRRMKQCLLHFPLIGRLYQQFWFIQIAQGLGLMLSSGMLLVHSLQSLRDIYGRSLFADELQQLAEQVAAGHPFGQCLQTCSFLPRMARQMLTIGEQSGALPSALMQLSQYYQQQFQQRLQVLIRMLEPCFVVLLGLAVLLMAGSLFLPMVQSYQYIL